MEVMSRRSGPIGAENQYGIERITAQPSSDRYSESQPPYSNYDVRLRIHESLEGFSNQTTIASLSPSVSKKKWTICVRVASKTSINNWSNSNGNGRVLNIYLVDKTGEIIAVAYDEVAERMQDVLEMGKVYYLSGGWLKLVDKKHSSVSKNDCRLMLTNYTNVKLCTEGGSDLPIMKYNVTSIADIENKEPNTLLDVIGVCSSVNKVTTESAQVQISKWEIQLVDQSNKMVTVSLYETEAETFDGLSCPVLAFKDCKVSDTGDHSLCAQYTTFMNVNPDILKTHQLRLWFDNRDKNQEVSSISNQQLRVEEDDVFYKEAMLRGYAESGLGLLIQMGVTGSGKSEFKRLVLGLNVPEFSPSTPLAEVAVRSMSLCQVEVDDVEWIIVDPQKMLKMVASALNGEIKSIQGESVKLSQSTSQSASVESEEMPEGNPLSDSEDAKLAVDGTHKSVRKVVHNHGAQLIREQYSKPLTTKFQEALKKQNIDKNLLKSVRTPAESEVPQLRGIDFIYLLDSGGQPAFREMLPHFVQQASAIVLMQKLNERLDYKPTIRYREEGGKVDKGYTSQLTNEQILQQYVQAVQSHNSKVFVIGTHRDKECECERETREQKDEKLQAALRPVLGEQMELYKVGNPDQLIFPVNSTSREPDIEAIAREFRKRVIEKCMGKKKKIPLPWLLLDQLLQSLSQDMGISVFSIEECFEAAQQKLSISHNVCRAALKYLGQLNIIFFCPDILPRAVFSSAQVILDKLTELVRCNHALRTDGGNGKAVPSCMHSCDGQQFREFGLLNSELLEKAFPSHYREGLFTAPDLLLLLERMLIAGRLNSGEHFIPSLLPDLPVEKIPEYRATADHPPPLVIYYHKMWLPVGVMSSLIVYLQNQCQWELSKEPSYHNCFLFDLPGGKPGDLVLIDSVEFLEIHIKSTCNLGDKYFHTVKGKILTGLVEAHASLHYSKPDLKFGFLCSAKCGDTKTHHATLDDEGTLWKCSKRPKAVWANLDERQKRWLQDSLEDKTHDTRGDHRARKQTLVDFTEVRRVLEPVKKRWKEIGMGLGLDLGTLKKWKKQYKEEEEEDKFLGEMVSLWENKKYNLERFGEPSWELLATVVRDPDGGDDSTLAETIINTHIAISCETGDVEFREKRCSGNKTTVARLEDRQKLYLHERDLSRSLRTSGSITGADSGEYPETTRIRENLPLIIKSVTTGGSPQHFSNHLVAKGFITQNTAQQILDTPQLAPDRQASKLMDSVFTKIQYSERRGGWFEKFVDIFDHDSVYEELVHKLQFQRESESMEVQSTGSVKSEDNSKCSTGKHPAPESSAPHSKRRKSD